MHCARRVCRLVPSVESNRLEHDAARIASNSKKERIFLTSDRQNRIVGGQMIGGSSIWPIRLHCRIDPVQSDSCGALPLARGKTSTSARRRGCDRLFWSTGDSVLHEFPCQSRN